MRCFKLHPTQRATTKPKASLLPKPFIWLLLNIYGEKYYAKPSMAGQKVVGFSEEDQGMAIVPPLQLQATLALASGAYYSWIHHLIWAQFHFWTSSTIFEKFTFECLQVFLVHATKLFLMVSVVGSLAVAVAVPVGLVALHPCIVRQPRLLTVRLEPELVPCVTVRCVRHPDNQPSLLHSLWKPSPSIFSLKQISQRSGWIKFKASFFFYTN